MNQFSEIAADRRTSKLKKSKISAQEYIPWQKVSTLSALHSNTFWQSRQLVQTVLAIVCKCDTTVLKPKGFSVIPTGCCLLHPYWHSRNIQLSVRCYSWCFLVPNKPLFLLDGVNWRSGDRTQGGGKTFLSSPWLSPTWPWLIIVLVWVTVNECMCERGCMCMLVCNVDERQRKKKNGNAGEIKWHACYL